MSLSKASKRSGRKPAEKKSKAVVTPAAEVESEVAALSGEDIDQFEDENGEPEPREAQPTVDETAKPKKGATVKSKIEVVGHVDKDIDALDARPMEERSFIALATVYHDERDNPAKAGDVITKLNREQVERFLAQNAIRPA